MMFDPGEYNEAVNKERRKRDQGSISVTPRRDDSNDTYDAQDVSRGSSDRIKQIDGLTDPKTRNPRKAF